MMIRIEKRRVLVQMVVRDCITVSSLVHLNCAYFFRQFVPPSLVPVHEVADLYSKECMNMLTHQPANLSHQQAVMRDFLAAWNWRKQRRQLSV